MIKNEPDNNLNEILKFNINRANEIVRLYEKQKYHYLNLNIALITISSVIYRILFDILNNTGIILLTFSLSIFFIISTINFIYCSIGNKTGSTKPTLCFYKKYNCEKIKDFSVDSILGDLRTQLNNLHKYQENYNNIAVKARIITLIGIVFLLISFTISIVVNYYT